MKNKYVREFSSPEEEIVCHSPLKIPMNDNKKFSIKEYRYTYLRIIYDREALYADISKRKKEQRKKW